MNEEQNAQQELDSFVSEFTAGLEPVTPEVDPNPAPPETKPTASATEGTQTEGTEAGVGTPKQDPDTQTQQGQGEQTPTEKPEDVFTKSGRAFAELRTTNKAQGEFLLRMARLAKLDAKTPAEALDLLTQQVTKIEAKNGNLTYEEVERIRQSDKEIAVKKAQLQEEARSGFDRLKELHGLSNKDILSFAEELKAKGLNPFEAPVDLVSQYRGMHYEQIIAKAREEGRQEEIDRRAKAQTQSTTPQTRVGSAQNDPGEKLDSIEALRAFLDSK